LRYIIGVAAGLALLAAGHPEFHAYGIFERAQYAGVAVTAYGHCIGYEVKGPNGLFIDQGFC
jgi:hypothetical protein